MDDDEYGTETVTRSEYQDRARRNRAWPAHVLDEATREVFTERALDWDGQYWTVLGRLPAPLNVRD